MTAILLSYTLIVAAQVISYGRMEPHALVMVILGLTAGFYAVLSNRPVSTSTLTARPALMLCTVVSLLLALVHNPLTYCGSSLWLTWLRSSVVVVVALLCTYPFTQSKPGWLSSIRFGLLLTLGIAARVVVPLFSPSPGEDVWVVQQEAAQAILNGQDPYSIVYTQIFSPDVYSLFGYRSGFHYPLVTAFPIAASLALTGDIRWAYVICELAVLRLLWQLLDISHFRQDRETRELILWLWAFNPSVLFILEHSWTEPLGLLFILLFAWFASRGRRWPAAATLSLFLSYKQYTLLLFPLLVFLPGAVPIVVCFTGINIISYVPWIFLNWYGLVDNLLAPWRAKPRADGLSIAALWIQIRNTAFPVWLSPLVMWVSLFLSWVRSERTPRGLIGILFVALGALFITAKQSFANYYYLLSFLLILRLILPPAVTFVAEARPPTENQ